MLFLFREKWYNICRNKLGGVKSVREKLKVFERKESYGTIRFTRRITIHEFRHSHASDLINRVQANPYDIAQRLGHSDVHEVFNCYIKFNIISEEN